MAFPTGNNPNAAAINPNTRLTPVTPNRQQQQSSVPYYYRGLPYYANNSTPQLQIHPHQGYVPPYPYQTTMGQQYLTHQLPPQFQNRLSQDNLRSNRNTTPNGEVQNYSPMYSPIPIMPPTNSINNYPRPQMEYNVQMQQSSTNTNKTQPNPSRNIIPLKTAARFNSEESVISVGYSNDSRNITNNNHHPAYYQLPKGHAIDLNRNHVYFQDQTDISMKQSVSRSNIIYRNSSTHLVQSMDESSRNQGKTSTQIVPQFTDTDRRVQMTPSNLKYLPDASRGQLKPKIQINQKLFTYPSPTGVQPIRPPFQHSYPKTQSNNSPRNPNPLSIPFNSLQSNSYNDHAGTTGSLQNYFASIEDILKGKHQAKMEPWQLKPSFDSKKQLVQSCANLRKPNPPNLGVITPISSAALRGRQSQKDVHITIADDVVTKVHASTQTDEIFKRTISTLTSINWGAPLKDTVDDFAQQFTCDTEPIWKIACDICKGIANTITQHLDSDNNLLFPPKTIIEEIDSNEIHDVIPLNFKKSAIVVAVKDANSCAEID